jgi:hypothetical protein
MAPAANHVKGYASFARRAVCGGAGKCFAASVGAAYVAAYSGDGASGYLQRAWRVSKVAAGVRQKRKY